VKRVLMCACVVVLLAALAVPALAAAAVQDYSGTDLDGGKVSFKATTAQGEVTHVKRFAWKHVPITCNEGDTKAHGTFFFAIDVKSDGTFRDKATNHHGGTATVTGRFTRHGRKVHGTFRLHGKVPPDHSCDTGTDSWKARRS
jgi:opacity protein-like surface antigen